MLASNLIIRSLIVGTLLATNLSCRPSPTVDARDQQEFWRSLDNRAYQATAERKQTILGNYSKLAVGLSHQEVKVLLGEPDYGSLQGTTNLWGPTGSVWHYFFSTRPGSTSSTDELVYVFFDRNNKVEAVLPVKIDGVTPIGFSEEDLKVFRRRGWI